MDGIFSVPVKDIKRESNVKKKIKHQVTATL